MNPYHERAIELMVGCCKGVIDILRDTARDIESNDVSKEQVVGRLDTMADQVENLLDATASKE